MRSSPSIRLSKFVSPTPRTPAGEPPAWVSICQNPRPYVAAVRRWVPGVELYAGEQVCSALRARRTWLRADEPVCTGIRGDVRVPVGNRGPDRWRGRVSGEVAQRDRSAVRGGESARGLDRILPLEGG